MQSEVNDFFNELKSKFSKIVYKNKLLDETVHIKARILKAEEAIGRPQRKEFPLVKGEEKIIEASFKNAIGHAFTDQPSNFEGTLNAVLSLGLNTNKERAIFIATINAVMRYLGLVKNTRHCKNEEPELCAEELIRYIKQEYGNVKVGIIGFQPAFVDHLRKHFIIRVTDYNVKNIGKIKYNILIENGYIGNKNVLEWADVILATGSSVVNGSIVEILPYREKTIFYGVTIAGPAVLLGLKRFCVYSK